MHGLAAGLADFVPRSRPNPRDLPRAASRVSLALTGLRSAHLRPVAGSCIWAMLTAGSARAGDAA